MNEPSSPVEIQVTRLKELVSMNYTRVKITTYSDEEDDQIRSNERRKDAEISPSVAEVHIKSLVELITDFVRTILACLRRVVEQISSPAALEEWLHVLATCLSGRRGESVIFRWLADDRTIVQFRHDHP